MHPGTSAPAHESVPSASGSNKRASNGPRSMHGGVRVKGIAAEPRPSAWLAARPRGRGAGDQRRTRRPWPFPGLAPGAAKSFQPKSTAPARAANRRTQPPRRSEEWPARPRRRDPRSRHPQPAPAAEVHLPQSREKSSSGKSSSSSSGGGVGGGSRSPAPGGEAEESCALPPPGHSGAGPGVRAIPHPPPGPLARLPPPTPPVSAPQALGGGSSCRSTAAAEGPARASLTPCS